MKGIFIPGITVEMFRNASLESVEDLMSSGSMLDIKIDEWIPIKYRPMTEEEVKEQEKKWDCTLADNEKIMFDCPLPVDEQDILISTSWGVSLDTCTYDPDEGYGLEMNGDWDGVSAWMPLPEKYEERKGESDGGCY